MHISHSNMVLYDHMYCPIACVWHMAVLFKWIPLAYGTWSRGVYQIAGKLFKDGIQEDSDTSSTFSDEKPSNLML